MIDASELRRNLAHYHGTDGYHGIGPMFSRVCFTDGVKYLAEEAECWWLITDSAALFQCNPWEQQGDDYMCIRLTIHPNGGFTHTVETGRGEVRWKNDGNSTDFPLREGIALPVRWDGYLRRWVVMLSSED